MANIDSGGIYAVIKEKNPPIVTNIYPGNDGSYYLDDFRKIEFNVVDNESGIYDETSIKLLIDDTKPVIFEYNTYRKQVTYKLDKKLFSGNHTLSIDVVDNVGNKTYKKIGFIRFKLWSRIQT